jgi:hypothetical protein
VQASDNNQDTVLFLFKTQRRFEDCVLTPSSGLPTSRPQSPAETNEGCYCAHRKVAFARPAPRYGPLALTHLHLFTSAQLPYRECTGALNIHSMFPHFGRHQVLAALLNHALAKVCGEYVYILYIATYCCHVKVLNLKIVKSLTIC